MIDSEGLERLEIATRAALSPLAATTTREWLRALGSAYGRMVGAPRWFVTLPHLGLYETSDGVDRQAIEGIHRYLLTPVVKGVLSEDIALHNFTMKMHAMGIETLNYGMVDRLLGGTGGGAAIRKTFFQMEVLEPGTLGNFYSMIIQVPYGGKLVPFAVSAYPDGPRRDDPGDPTLTMMRMISPAIRAGMDIFHRTHAQRLALDGVADPMAVHDTLGRPVHRNAALAALLAADPEHERVEGEMRALAGALAAMIVRRRGVEPHRAAREVRRVQVAEHEVRIGDGGLVTTARGTYQLRGSLLPHPVVGVDGSVMITTQLESAEAALPPVEAIRERFGLTPREADVALLVAEGLSNQEIAERRGISAFTARNHVEKVLGKLKVDSRKAVALTLVREVGGRR